MILHARVPIVQRAKLEHWEFVDQLRQRHALTVTEVLIVLNEQIATELKYALRAERHPDAPDTPSGIE